ncbi:efflux RND transporter periplasmic adaptor subunit [Telmatobacter sp. DSM 110680]|uniref:Efflux RND transporter periplasmic adaptor subunit n=1 Tax=Telmatobacter sp. DSM 110680 TaxID=3036704 RepID=A0AAU7DG97_9BACT
MKKSRTGIWVILGIVVVCGVGAVIAMNRKSSSLTGADEIPLALVKRGDVEIEVHARGEVSAAHSSMLAAPAIGGDALQITRLPQTGDRIKKGDVVIEFDPSEQHYKLDQNRSELQQAEQEITKAKDDALVLAAEDKVALLKARYDVRRAELDVEKKELDSKIDAQKHELTLQQNRRVLEQLEKDVESHKATGQASIFLAQEKYNKAKLAMDQAQQNLDHMHVTAPMDGLVSIQKNMDATGGMFFGGMSLPDFRPGDQVRPGSAIVQVLDLSGMNLTAHVQEDQHDNVKAGEPVEVAFDAIPSKKFRGTVKTVAGMAMQSFFSSESAHNFDVTIQLVDADPGLRPGLTAEIVFKGTRQTGVNSIPRQALFMKDGKRVVFVRAGSSYQQREVQIKGESETRAVIEGLAEGTQVALLDPTVPRKTGPAGSGSSSTMGAP